MLLQLSEGRFIFLLVKFNRVTMLVDNRLSFVTLEVALVLDKKLTELIFGNLECFVVFFTLLLNLFFDLTFSLLHLVLIINVDFLFVILLLDLHGWVTDLILEFVLVISIFFLVNDLVLTFCHLLLDKHHLLLLLIEILVI